ncbi:MAG: sporulation protein YqfD [Anaerovoracaceae bacterium]
MRAEYRGLNFSVHRVKIKIEGFRIDRLLDKAMKRGLDVRNIRIISPLQAVCWVTPQDLAELKKMAKALYKITEEEHRGPENRIRKFIRTPLKVAGVVVVLALVISQSFFVKTIEVSGYKAIPETLLRECLSESGVSEGAYRPAIDWKAAENHVYETFPQITWLQLVYDGRKVFLNIAESEDPIVTEEFSREEERKYTNIVASRSGYIETVSIYRGMLLTEEGEFVRKGQVLVSGYVPTEPTVYEENWPKGYYVRCSGEIWAKVPYRLTFNQERYVSSSGAGSAADGIVSSKREKSEDEIRAKANQQLRQWIKENLPEEAEILNKDLNFSYKENIIEVGVTLEVRQQIGEEQEILIGEESTDTSGD